MTRRELIDAIRAAAEAVYDRREAEAVARLVTERRYGLTRADVALEPQREVVLEDEPEFRALLADIASQRPVQYVLGVADFDGMELSVDEGVLIPRPETEELVRWIASSEEHNAADACFSRKILDIGTGSGAIALALARRMPEARVTAVDVSGEALRYARLNGEKYSPEVDFIEADILDPATYPPALAEQKFDAIVSNPPYIPSRERAAMAPNVTEWEPERALFVPDSDPLLFYRAIARFARHHLAPEGTLWFEIHESAARKVAELLAAEGFKEIEVRRDINDRPRMVKCRL
jgi:release factor glutamine methyltransferase